MFGEVAAVKDFASADHALFAAGVCLAKLDKFAEAGALYAKVATDFAQSAYRRRCDDRRRPLLLPGRQARRSGSLAGEGGRAQGCQLARSGPLAVPDSDQGQESRPRRPTWRASNSQPAATARSSCNLARPGRRAVRDCRQAGRSAGAVREVRGRHPQHELAPQALYNAAFAALELKQYDEGLKHAAAFLAAFPQDKLRPDVKYVAAECNLQLKKYPEAEKALYASWSTARQAMPTVDAWRVRLGLVAYLQKKYDEAIAALSPIAATLEVARCAGRGAVPDRREPVLHRQVRRSRAGAGGVAGGQSQVAASRTKRCCCWRRSQAKTRQAATPQGQPGEAAGRVSREPAARPGALSPGRAGLCSRRLQDGDRRVRHRGDEVARVAVRSLALYGKGWSQLKSKEFATGRRVVHGAARRSSPSISSQPTRSFGRAMCRRQAGDAKGAIADLDAYLKIESRSGAQERCALRARPGAGRRQRLRRRGRHARRLLKADPKYAAADKVLYEIGWALKSQDKHAEAVPQFAKLAAEHRRQPAGGGSLVPRRRGPVRQEAIRRSGEVVRRRPRPSRPAANWARRRPTSSAGRTFSSSSTPRP